VKFVAVISGNNSALNIALTAKSRGVPHIDNNQKFTEE
jgi:hypothetical protein